MFQMSTHVSIFQCMSLVSQGHLTWVHTCDMFAAARLEAARVEIAAMEKVAVEAGAVAAGSVEAAAKEAVVEEGARLLHICGTAPLWPLRLDPDRFGVTGTNSYIQRTVNNM